MTEATTEAKTPRTLEQKLEATLILAEKYKAQINALKQINNVEVGDDVTFNYGRADKVRSLSGVVQAVGDPDFGRMVAVLSGEGIDATILKIRAEHITENRTADARGPVEGEAPASDDSDPLNAE